MTHTKLYLDRARGTELSKLEGGHFDRDKTDTDRQSNIFSFRRTTRFATLSRSKIGEGGYMLDFVPKSRNVTMLESHLHFREFFSKREVSPKCLALLWQGRVIMPRPGPFKLE